MRLGYVRPRVRHFAWTTPGADRYWGRDFSHHELTQNRPGARYCGICGRWVIRGMGRWWEEVERGQVLA